MTIITPAINLLQTSFSAYNLYLASIAIRNLLQYEEKAKKAAKWSDTAAQELWKTRSTQASNALSTTTKALLIGTNIAALSLARYHVGAYWSGKAKIPIPGVGDYNEAISVTQRARLNMLYLTASWLAVGFLVLVF